MQMISSSGPDSRVFTAEKWNFPYSQVCGLVKARVSIAIARATHLCIRGSRIPASKMSKKVQWDDGAGLGLFETDC